MDKKTLIDKIKSSDWFSGYKCPYCGEEMIILNEGNSKYVSCPHCASKDHSVTIPEIEFHKAIGGTYFEELLLEESGE